MAGTTLTPEQRSIRARIGAFALHAQGGTSTRAGTAAFLARFTREVEAAAAARGETLAPAETERRAQLLRRAHFARLALASSRARGNKKPAPVGEMTGSGQEAQRGRHHAEPRPSA